MSASELLINSLSIIKLLNTIFFFNFSLMKFRLKTDHLVKINDKIVISLYY